MQEHILWIGFALFAAETCLLIYLVYDIMRFANPMRAENPIKFLKRLAMLFAVIFTLAGLVIHYSSLHATYVVEEYKMYVPIVVNVTTTVAGAVKRYNVTATLETCTRSSAMNPWAAVVSVVIIPIMLMIICYLLLYISKVRWWRWQI